ncbi:hypothetical protein DPMN_077444 [Dreissena polymorpha]|uniref:Uncharacterized protein n=1 Tax=Dreissena polymorpha TaxID=45954 RepID=A0A9D3YKH8_DREPO|nr:hypothetical protein DPMN_077444 [Dreissena polymorpha]
MMLHALEEAKGYGSLAIRNTSCACSNCFEENSFKVNSLYRWETCSISEKSRRVVNNDEADSCSTGQTEAVNKVVAKEKPETLDIAIEKYVIARYNDKCYVGKVSEICNEDNTIHISFMTECGKVGGRYKGLNVEDNVWINTEDIVQVIADPIATSKTGRMFTFPVDVLQLLNN